MAMLFNCSTARIILKPRVGICAKTICARGRPRIPARATPVDRRSHAAVGSHPRSPQKRGKRPGERWVYL